MTRSSVTRPSVTLRIRDAIASDLAAVCAIERVSFPDPWVPAMFRTHLRPGVNTFLVAEEEPELVGYAISHTVADVADLLNLAVRPDARGHGVGAALLDALMTRCAVRGAESMTLDVRESNTAARALYASRGFTPIGRRRRYYRMPDEDALVLHTHLRASAPAQHDDDVG